MNKVAQFLQEDNGNFSATRLAFLAWIFGTLIMWGTSSFQASERKMQDIPQSVQVLIGILMSGKVVQKFREDQPERSDANNAEDASQQITSQQSKNGTVVPTTHTQAASGVAQQ